MPTSKITLGYKTCDKNHPKIRYTGSYCPACRNREAGLAILHEYVTLTGICRKLMAIVCGRAIK